jgi:hypothetical protein
MKQRKQWTILALVLLPSAVAIATLSLTRLVDSSLSKPAVPAPASGTTISAEPVEAPPLQAPAAESDPASPSMPSAPETTPTINTPEQELEAVEDPEQRQLIPITMFADNYAAPAFEF